MPPWVQSGGLEEWEKRLKDPAVRARLIKEMRTPTNEWENLLLLSGSPDNVLLVAFKNPKLKPLTGKTLAEVAKMRGKSPEETAMDLVVEDDSRVGTVYFLMSEDNVKREVGLPWMSFGSDEASPAPEGVFLKSQSHPRAYGNVARLLGHYVRDEHATTLQDAVRRLTSLPATNLSIRQRGSLKPGYYADVVVFDPATIADHATFAKPAQLATGVDDVFINGTQVLKDGKQPGPSPDAWSAALAGPAGRVEARAASLHARCPLGPPDDRFPSLFQRHRRQRDASARVHRARGRSEGRGFRPLARRRAARRTSSSICARSGSSCFRRMGRACRRG